MAKLSILFFVSLSLPVFARELGSNRGVSVHRELGNNGYYDVVPHHKKHYDHGKGAAKSPKSPKSYKKKYHKGPHDGNYYHHYPYYYYDSEYYYYYHEHPNYPHYPNPYHPHYPDYPSPVPPTNSPPAPTPTASTPTQVISGAPVISVLTEFPTTESNTNLTDLVPPQNVVERTSAPTPQAIASIETFSVETETLSFRASGTSDLGSHEVAFFEEVERILAPYARSQVGSVLTKFLLSIVFEHDKLDVISLGVTGQNTLYRSLFQISTVFDLEGYPEQLSSFRRQEATELLTSLFSGQMLQRLISALATRDIRISNIAEHDPSNEETDSGDRDNNQDQVNIIRPPPVAEQSEEDKSSRNALLITLFSGALVVLALGIGLLFNIRRRRRYFHYGEKTVRSSYAPSHSVNSDGDSKVQRAALATKSYQSRDFLRNAATASSSLAPMLDDIENSYSDNYVSSSYQEEKTEVEPLDPPATVLPPSDIMGATLTNLDGGHSVGELNSEYPEFEMFVGLKQPASPGTKYEEAIQDPPSQNHEGSPISPYWSVDGAISSSSGAEDEEYLEDRRRWQEEANDIGLGSAAEHASSHEVDDGSGTSDDASSEESEEGWSDENDSYDDRKIQILPDID